MGRYGGIATVAAATLALAGLDIMQSVVAKEWSIRRNDWLLLIGLATSITVFAVFAFAMRYADMSTVTVGWLVLLQAGLMITEHVRYGVHHGSHRWAAVGAMVVLQIYLLTSSEAVPA